MLRRRLAPPSPHAQPRSTVALLQVNIASKNLAAFSKGSAQGEYEYTPSLFDSAADVVYKMIKQVCRILHTAKTDKSPGAS